MSNIKKIAFIILAMCIVISFLGCGAYNKEKAEEQAAELLEQIQGEAAYWYDGEYGKVSGVEHYCVYAFLDESAASSDYYELVKVLSAKDVFNDVYPSFEAIFSKAKIPVAVFIADHKGNVFARIVNGELEID